jgi:predicted CXXCH cytochrome family protein
MRNYRARTAIELASIAALLVLMTVFIRPGQGEEDLRRIHKGVDCVKCHAPVASIAETVAIPDASTQCSTCHTRKSLVSNSRLPFHATTSRSCTDCHSFHQPDVVTVKGNQFHIRFNQQNREALCGSCHSADADINSISAGHRRAAALYHSDNQILTALGPSDACLVCHSDRSSAHSAGGSLDLQAPTFTNHGHPTGIVVFPGSGRAGNRIRVQIDSRIPLFGGKLECQSCHSLTVRSRNLLTSSMSTTELCQGCHELDG